MGERIPVAFRFGHSWRPGLSFEQLCRLLMALTEPDQSEVAEGAIRPLRLDMVSRRQDDNPLKLSEKAKRRRNQTYRINKGLAMELATAALLTYTDHPAEVRGNCKPNDHGLPSSCAPSGLADIVVRPDGGTPFRIVCEVSAMYGFDDSTLDKQLSGTVAHAAALNDESKVRVTYGLLINCGRIGEKKCLQRFYRDFIAGKRGGWWKKVEDKAAETQSEMQKGLDLDGPIRLVSIYTGEFVTLIRRLHDKGNLSFDSQLFAKALDDLHERLRSSDVSKKKKKKKKKKRKEDWMAEAFIKTVTLKTPDPEPEPQGDMLVDHEV